MTIRVAIAGLGAIGIDVARRLDAGAVPGMRLIAASARNRTRAERALAAFSSPPVLTGLAELAGLADVIVECLPARRFRDVAEPALAAGRTLVPLSVGALLDHEDLIGLAARTGGRIHVPSGAILGLDALRAVAEGTISSVRIVTRKPPAGLAGAPLLAECGLSLDGLDKPLMLFSGSAREAVKGFPANVNVAVAVALAGFGADRTLVEIWADPGVTRNTHTVVATSDSSDLTMTIENTPSADNPRTGTITAHSVLAALRRHTAPLVVGT